MEKQKPDYAGYALWAVLALCVAGLLWETFVDPYYEAGRIHLELHVQTGPDHS